MAKMELHTSDLPIDQMPPVTELPADRDSPVILTDRIESNDYLEALAFNEDPVTIRIEPSAEENAPTFFPCWVNGKGAEVLVGGKWVEFRGGQLPIGEVLTTKRKYLEVMIRSKRNTVVAQGHMVAGEDAINETRRMTSATLAISIIEDRNPRGAAWATEFRRRNF
jgi:hypothetical protein